MNNNKTYEQLLADNKAKEELIAKLLDEINFLKQALTQELDNYRDCLEILNLIARYNAREMLSTLTNREIEVLQYIGNGFVSKEIAGKINLSIDAINKRFEKIKCYLELVNNKAMMRFNCENEL